MAFDAPDPTLYNSGIDKVSLGAQHSKAWKEYKQHGTLGRDEDKDKEVDVIGSDDDDEVTEKRYGKRYPRVWTKGAHGGKYKISTGPGSRTGYDALEQNPDGTALTVAPGYEKPDSGATTNFVGNHMTQGAIDLVQNELTRPDPEVDTRMARLDAARGIKRMPPRLLEPDEVPLTERAQTLETNATRPVERYAWADDTDEVVVVVRSGDIKPGVRANMEGAQVTSEPSGSTHEPRAPLVLVIPDADGAGSSVLTLRLAGGVDSLTMVKTRDEVKLVMVKSESSRGGWKTLKAREALSLGDKDASSDQPPPDLSALRRQILERREGKLANQLPWFGDNNRKFLAATADDGTSLTRRADIDAVVDPTAALVTGLELAARGEHAEADVFFSRGLELVTDDGDPRTCARLHAARSRAREQLGDLRSAVEDHTATLAAVERGGSVESEGVDACSALLARGRCRMQLEDYVAACEDFTTALRFDPSSRAASGALRDGKRLADQQARAREKEVKCAKGTPVLFAKPGLRQFEPRGKAGSAF